MNLHVVTALFIYLLPHIVYPKALEYGILAFRRIERSEVEGQNSEMFQKCRSSDLPLSIPLNTRTLAYNKPCSNYATNYNYFPLIIYAIRCASKNNRWDNPLAQRICKRCLLFWWAYHAEPYQQYDRVFIGVSVLSTFKHYRASALLWVKFKLHMLHCGSIKIYMEPNWSNIRG